jgi:hypothetical protein
VGLFIPLFSLAPCRPQTQDEQATETTHGSRPPPGGKEIVQNSLPRLGLDRPAIAHKWPVVQRNGRREPAGHTSRRPRRDTRPSEPCPNGMYLRTAAAGLRSLCWLNPASERVAQPSAGNILHLFVRKPALSPDIFTTPPRSAKVISFVPLLILIATKGPSETPGPFSSGAQRESTPDPRRETVVRRGAVL